MITKVRNAFRLVVSLASLATVSTLMAPAAQAIEYTGAQVHEQYCDTDWLAEQGVEEYVGYYGVNAVFTKVRNVTADSVSFDVYPSTTVVNGVCKANTSTNVTLDNFRVTYTTDPQASLSSYTVVDFAMNSDLTFQTITISGLDANTPHYFITYYQAAGVNQGGNISSYAPSTIYTLPENGTFEFTGDELTWSGYSEDASLRVDLFDVEAGSNGWLVGAQMGTTGSYDGYALTYANRADGLLGVSVVAGPDALIKNERYYQWAKPIVGMYKKNSEGEWVLKGFLEHNCTGDVTGVDNECIGAALENAQIGTDKDGDGVSDIAPVDASKFKKLSKKLLQIKAVNDADYYKVIFRSESSKGKQLVKYANLKSTKKNISATDFAKLSGKKVHVSIYACNEAGCAVVATKTKTF